MSRVTATAFFAMCVLAGCGREESQQPAASPAPPVAAKQVHVGGGDVYREGLAAKAADDLDRAEDLFRRATRMNHELAEAWYELGRLQVQQAPELAKSDELKAMQTFREGLQAEQEALRLLNERGPALWTSEEETEARTHLDVDLRDAEQALGDEEALREALRMRVY